jgi:hypothetical protein
MKTPYTPMSSPGSTGRPSTLRRIGLISDALEYWVPAFAGMTTVFGDEPC